MQEEKKTAQRAYKYAYAQKLRQRITEAEQTLWGAVRNRRCAGVKFRRQVPLGDYVVDFCAFEVDLVIEIDGGIHDEKEQQAYDKWREKVLIEGRFTVLRFRNEEVLSGLSGVLEKISATVGSLKVLQNKTQTFPLSVQERGLGGEAYTAHTHKTIRLSQLRLHDCFVLLETTKRDSANQLNYLFTDPIEIIELYDPSELEVVFARIEQLSQRYFLAGYFSYELGYALHETVFSRSCPKKHTVPLLRLGVFDRRDEINRVDDEVAVSEIAVSDLHFSLKKVQYAAALKRIQRLLQAGETYQVNFTGEYRFSYAGDPLHLYAKLRQSQPVPYGACVKFGSQWVLSYSPELFFRSTVSADGTRTLTMQPMKGTAGRGRNLFEDAKRMEDLQTSEKDRAENLMIVDLVRNDLGQICRPGTVEAVELCAVQRLPTVWQMTSTIQGKVREDVTWQQIFQALFPCGSVTGAPKLRTMEIIRQLEKMPRGVYCGAIGYIGPGGDGAFNVPIRTVTLRPKQSSSALRTTKFVGAMGSGSGITIGSNVEREWAELKLKAVFLTHPRPSFQLVETLQFNGEYLLLHMHLKRLSASAAYFDFLFDEKRVRLELEAYARGLTTEKIFKVRLLLAKDGSIIVSGEPMSAHDAIGRIAICPQRTHSQDVFLFHKTTHRPLYEKYYARARARGLDDIIFLNEYCAVTEGCISNLIVALEGQWWTPPVECGLLPGVYRQWLLDNGRIKEKTLSLQDLHRAEALYLCNAVRGLRQVILTAAAHKSARFTLQRPAESLPFSGFQC